MLKMSILFPNPCVHLCQFLCMPCLCFFLLGLLVGVEHFSVCVCLPELWEVWQVLLHKRNSWGEYCACDVQNFYVGFLFLFSFWKCIFENASLLQSSCLSLPNQPPGLATFFFCCWWCLLKYSISAPFLIQFFDFFQGLDLPGENADAHSNLNFR